MLYPFKGRHHERGQSLSEYAPTFPAVIAIIIIATSGISFFVKGALTRTLDGLNGVSACPDTDESREGVSVADVGPHRIGVVGFSYNPTDNTTTIVYRVESRTDPSISHWTLGVSERVAQSVLQASEAYAWTASDPTTGLAGIKFDTGYESSGGGGGGGSSGGKGGGKKSGALPASLIAAKLLTDAPSQSGNITTYQSDPLATSRDIYLLLAGEYAFEQSTVTIKAGTETYAAELIVPVPVDEVEEGC